MKHLPELRTVQCFAAVVREGNVTRAAEKLHLSQPAVTQQLKNLSERSGLTLFTRTSKGLQLTPDGAILAHKAEQLLAMLDEFRQTARDLAGQVRGSLRIGTILDPDFIRLGAFFNTLVRRTPSIRAELTHGMSGDVPARILRDELDAGFYLGDVNAATHSPSVGRDDDEALFHRVELASFPYWVIAPPGWEHRIAGRNWDELAALPWIGTPPASVHARLLEPVFRQFGVTQNIITVVDQEPSMLAMVRSGVGLSLCRDSIALNERQTRGMVISDTVEIWTTLDFICLTARRQDPVIRTACDILLQVWE
ncbi:LysR family transcriptional regulator [Granulosicoccus antarcticus]|uniref:HTH-type transcriptional regulator CynR n=1 Tax=Granulosicoccus antarcticus IMCC3135 TaxID=1192854 RepID=A0A2Z2NJA6_9GAMM|nr:LysR family transcriptional regulator [Granulosicoccus antarcticus]ASJ71259.1 HTH-type transcriptional regulator CynR [Granulosicoccus antarcticus IMCC3135]